MPRARTAVALRVPTKRDTKEEYDFAGEFHWTDWIEVPVRQFNTIWNIPLSAFGDEIQTEEGVLAPLCKNSMAQEYYLVKFDADYLKERFYREWVEALRWTPATVRTFFKINEEWFNERIQYFQRSELREQAVHIAELDPQGRDVEFWLNQLLGIKDEEPKVTEEVSDYEAIGELRRISGEYFLVTQDEKRYKLEKRMIDNPDNMLGTFYQFNIDTERAVPKARKASGWVSELVVRE